MHFILREGWFCQFLEEDLKTLLPKKITLEDPGKLFEIAERGGYKLTFENRQAIENAIAMGRGSIWLDLTKSNMRSSKSDNLSSVWPLLPSLGYLRNKLQESRNRKPDAYCREFLCPLLFQGFARKKGGTLGGSQSSAR